MFMSEAFAQAVNKAIERNVDLITSQELQTGFAVIVLMGMLGGGISFYFSHKGKKKSIFVFMGHMFLCFTAGITTFLMIFASGRFKLAGPKEDVYMVLATTALLVGGVCSVGPEAISIFRSFVKNRLLAFLEKLVEKKS